MKRSGLAPIVGAAGEILLTEDGGKNWHASKDSGATSLSLFGVDLGSNGGIAVGQSGLILVEDKDGIWQKRDAGLIAYFIGEIRVQDENNYTSEFLPLARKSIADGGGKYVAGGFNKTVAFSGEPPPNRVVIIQFENMDKAKAWYDSPAQKDSHKIGDKFAAFREFIVEGVEQK